MSKTTGVITSISGNMLTVKVDGDVIQNEIGFVLSGEEKLKSEIVKINRDTAFMQVFEDTKGVKVGDQVEFAEQMLSVELGPGLLGMVYDGLQNPLHELAENYGFFMERGAVVDSLDRNQKWDFTPTVEPGASLVAGDQIGLVQEGIFDHPIFLPFRMTGEFELTRVAEPGEYTIEDTIAEVNDKHGETTEIKMFFRWPVKEAIDLFEERQVPDEPMVTQTRVIDSFFPVSKGGTYCIPGPFGSGKTVLQQVTSRFAAVDVVIIAACGERAGEVVETLREFPELEDPQTGKTLMERTIIICNTSSMPVAARESSVYTAVTLGEYYRQLGLDVLLLADSTSRWAQAMRELSGRLEEIPGEEAFPAYLESRIAQFYERAGFVKFKNGKTGSLTIGGTVSPAGGNFEEPVTQSTLKVVGAFHGLSRDRANQRRYPAIDPLDSWTKYDGFIETKKIDTGRQILSKGNDVSQMMKVVGEEGTTLDDFIIYLKSEFIDNVYLQQDSFDPIEGATSPARQEYVYDVVLKVLKASFDFEKKAEAREFFNDLRQLFIDWNYMPMEADKEARETADDSSKQADDINKTDEFKEQETKILNLIEEHLADAKSS